MAEKQPATIQEGTATVDEMPLASLEESLLSLEKLDRTSPELWPEQNNSSDDCDKNEFFAVPGVSDFAPLCPSQSPPAWSKGLSADDVNLMNQLGTLSTHGLIIEVKKLHDLAYQLGMEEAKEMTRGKHLEIFTSKRNK